MVSKHRLTLLSALLELFFPYFTHIHPKKELRNPFGSVQWTYLFLCHGPFFYPQTTTQGLGEPHKLVQWIFLFLAMDPSAAVSQSLVSLGTLKNTSRGTSGKSDENLVQSMGLRNPKKKIKILGLFCLSDLSVFGWETRSLAHYKRNICNQNGIKCDILLTKQFNLYLICVAS